MATQVLTDCGLWLAGYDLRGQMNALGIDYGTELRDATVYGSDTRINAAGPKTYGFSHQGFFDAAAVDKPLFDRIGVQNELMTITPSGVAAGDVAYLSRIIAGQYTPGASYGDLLAFSVSGQAGDGPLVRGTLMINASAVASSGDGTARQLGAVGASQKLYAGLHVISASGTSPTLDVTVESDSSNSFVGGETTRVTFAQATTIGAEWAAPISGAVADTWWRISYAIGGTTPSFSFVVSLGIQ